MLNSSERIITTHAGSLPRPDALPPMIQARARGADYLGWARHLGAPAAPAASSP